MADDNELRAQVAEVAAAYFSNTHVNPADISSVVNLIATSLAAVGTPASEAEPAAGAIQEPARKKATPAQIRKSITDDALISFEDGRGYKTLKRHLSTRGMTVEAYKEKWGLPKDYPSVAPSYSAARSQMAKALGLGQMGARTKDAATVAKKPSSRRAAKATPA